MGSSLTVTCEVGSNICNLQVEPWEGQVYEIVVKKMKKCFEVDVLINGESTGIDNYPTFGGVYNNTALPLYKFVKEV